MKLDIVPADAELLSRFYGQAPTRSVRALVGLAEGEPVVVGGLYWESERSVLFANIAPVVREKFVLSGVKFAKALLPMIRESRGPVFALAQENIETSCRFLEWMGFKQVNGRIYAWQP